MEITRKQLVLAHLSEFRAFRDHYERRVEEYEAELARIEAAEAAQAGRE